MAGILGKLINTVPGNMRLGWSRLEIPKRSERLAKQRIPSPLFHYIDGGSDDEITLNRNTKAFDDCDLIPNVLAQMNDIDLSTEIFGQKILSEK